MTDNQLHKISALLPFWAALTLVPAVIAAAIWGGWAVLLPPFVGYVAFSLMDAAVGLDTANPDPNTDPATIRAYKLITLIWPPVQFLLTFGTITYLADATHLNSFEKIAITFGLGLSTGTVGINFAHELMHQSSRLERWLADLLLAMVLYSHFRSEHLLVHHPHVGTPRDAVTARYNEGFHRFFPRVVRQSLRSAFRAEGDMLARRNLPRLDPTNPFWRYWALQGFFLFLALLLGGWAGLGLFLYQSFIAIWLLESINYIEHYGLTRKKLPNGKYEPVSPRHSWNASHKASNWLLINLQRHSDHHTKPARPYPLLQNYEVSEAPQLPYGYPIMAFIANIPPLWRRMMNPRVRQWRATYYPEVSDWKKPQA